MKGNFRKSLFWDIKLEEWLLTSPFWSSMRFILFSIMLGKLTELLGNLMLSALEGISSSLAGLHCVMVEAYYLVSRGSRSRIRQCDAMPQLWENWNRSHKRSGYGEIDDCRLPILKKQHINVWSYINMVAIYSLLIYI